jgi:hypothetical protein
MLKQMARDVNYSFINGVYNKPTDNTTKRQTAGLLSVDHHEQRQRRHPVGHRPGAGRRW